MRGSRTVSWMSAARRSRAFSPVGNSVWSWAIRPPRNGRFSTSVTFIPRWARSRAATSPATPPPITSAEGWIGMRRFSSGTRCEARAAAARTRREAFRVAASRSSTTHETCSRTLTCSKRYWLRPARSIVRRKVVWCRVGEQAATTTRSSSSSRIFCSMSAWPGSEQTKGYAVASTTPGMRAASAATRSTSTTSEMFPPQWQTKTPMRGGWAGAGSPGAVPGCVTDASR